MPFYRDPSELLDLKLMRKLAELEDMLRTERDPERRKRLEEMIERLRKDLGY
ncbi:hypothetical protein [Microvirga sp. CF3016]|uniref:hypothetical protein n=1 Tax=Microvirga sp. CF3016 TaxID=3110181 RepID=UPI002E75ADB4|nr:hypothetical protein [Microvirga sp. CF3016]MEE1611117.1 hypothetical protein [Microvirga sp. CF3016]